MPEDEPYNYKGTENFVIENGIIRGYDCPEDTENIGNYGEMVLEALKAKPKFVPQVDGLTGREVTFAEMLEKSVKCAMWLKKENVEPGDVIAICTHNQTDMYVPCFATLYVGATYNGWWNSGLTKEMAKYFIALTTPKILFATKETASVAVEAAKEIGAEMKIVLFGKRAGFQSLDDILASQDTNLVREFRCTKLSSLDEPAFIMYTSGTGGLPKGVLHSHKSLRANVKDFSTIGETSSMTSLVFSPVCWFTGHYCMYRCLVLPDRRIIYPEYSEKICLELIEKFKVNWLFLPTSAAIRVTKSPAKASYDLSSIKFVLTGGAPMKEEAQKALAETFPSSVIFQAYGMSELGGLGVRQSLNYKPGSCGRVIKNYALKVVDPETGKILAPNKTGEACFKYPFTMMCYYRNPEETSKVIDSDGWLHSGDLVFYDEEGYLFYVDRMKEVIKYRDNHVSPAMIERVLLTHPGVVHAAVLGIPHETDDTHPIAFVVKTEDAELSEAELQKIVADVLPDHMRLRGGVKFLKELPHTPSGKVARGELKKLAESYAL